MRAAGYAFARLGIISLFFSVAILEAWGGLAALSSKFAEIAVIVCR
jgi:hypothetical protein